MTSMGRGLLALALVALTGCGYFVHGLSESDGVVHLDGVALPHARWVLLEVPAGLGALELETGTRDICLAGSTDGSTRIELQVFSEVEGDGEVSLQGGRATVRSTQGRKVVLNGARGTLGQGFALRLQGGTGGVSLVGVHGLQRVEIESGTGDVELSVCQVEALEVDSGTGDVELRDVRCGDVGVSTGTGSVELSGCQVAGLEIDTGTADVTLRDTRATRTQIESGTGDVLLRGQNQLGSTSYDLGTGKVEGG